MTFERNSLRVPEWDDYSWLIHGFSTREFKSEGNAQEFNLGFTASRNPEGVSSNRQLFVADLQRDSSASIGDYGLVTLKQMHSALARRVGRTDISERASLWGDGLLTNEVNVILGIQTADCLPILVADTKRRCVAAYHAGWRGTLKGIVEQGIESMRREFGSDPGDLTAAIGPGIGRCCFEVGGEVRDLFQDRFAYGADLFIGGPKLKMDLAEANRRQLLASGLSTESIFVLNQCTSCRTDFFFSYRAEGGKTGRMMSAIAITAYELTYS